MPTPQTYEVTAPDGRVFDVSGEGGPPTEAELEEIFRTLPKPANAPPAVETGRGGAYAALHDIGVGAVSGAASTAVHGGDLLRRFLGMERIINKPDVQALITPPASVAGKTGYMLEQGAEFLAPTLRVAKAVKTLPTLVRWGLEGAVGAGVAGVQTGGEPGSMALAAVAPPMGAGIGTVAKGAIGVAQRAAAGAAEGGLGGAVAGAIRKTVPTASVPMLVQALKPRNTQINFPKVLETALPEIKAAERQLGKPIETVDDLIAAAKTAKQDLWSQYEGMAGPSRARGTVIDGDPIANAIEASIPSRTLRQNPTAARAVRAVADTYRPGLNMQEAEQLLLETNAELQAYYSKFPAAQRASEAANPEIAHLVAEAKALRKGIYDVLDAPGEGAAAREVKRRYGALMEVEQAAQRRSPVAARQQPESLSEQIGKVRAAADLARGVLKIGGALASGRPGLGASGVADIAGAYAGREAATFLKEQQTTNALIRRALASHKGLPVPVPPVPQTPIRGLLPPGVTRLGPGTDPSDLPGITQRGEYGYREPLGPEPPPLGPEPPSLGPEPAPLGPEPAPYGPEPAAYGPEPPSLGPERAPAAPITPTPTSTRHSTALARNRMREKLAGYDPPKAPVESTAPAPSTDIRSDPRYVKGTASKKAAAVVKPVAPAAPVAAPEQAAAKVTKQIERLIDVSGSKSAGEVRMRVLDGLQKELAGAQQDAGFASVTAIPQKLGRLVIAIDGKAAASIDRYGAVDHVFSDDLQGFTDTRGVTTYEGPEALKSLMKKTAIVGHGRWSDLTPTEKAREASLVVAAAFGRAKDVGQVVMRIPGDGVFTVERNPHAIQLLLDKIKKSSPSIWKDLVKKK